MFKRAKESKFQFKHIATPGHFDCDFGSLLYFSMSLKFCTVAYITFMVRKKIFWPTWKVGSKKFMFSEMSLIL